MFIFDYIRKKRIAKETAAFERSGMLRSFTYSFGTMADGMTVFVIKQEDDCLSMIYQKTSMRDGKEIGSVLELPLDMAQKIKSLIRQSEIFLWNGYNKNNSVIQNGHSFTLEAVFDNYILRASAVSMMPPDYTEKHSLIKRFLEGLVKRYYTEISEV